MTSLSIALIQIERQDLIADLKDFERLGQPAVGTRDIAAMRRRLQELNGVIKLRPVLREA
jgi:hypothetical protein